ncbi:protein shuttle craft [Culicoides brevitarsis]|uniref:protein shuttle craft n=1 Tax=Culicoides brevitarsis TaxID=469753 RepID=UPI00307BED7E
MPMAAGPSTSVLTANAAEFVPNNRREQQYLPATSTNATTNGQNYQFQQNYPQTTMTEEKYKGAIRKQYNNQGGRNYYQNNSRHGNRRFYNNNGTDHGTNGYNGRENHNWKRRDDFRRQGEENRRNGEENRRQGDDYRRQKDDFRRQENDFKRQEDENQRQREDNRRQGDENRRNFDENRRNGSQQDLSHKEKSRQNTREDHHRVKNDESRRPRNHDNNGRYNKHYSKGASQKKSPPKITFDASNCSQREKLTKEMENSVLECMICCENIKSTQSVFSCNACFHIFHLNCVKKWANSSFAEGWRCPACNSFKETLPKDYYCFCGKLKDPQYNRNDTPHSCGEMCGRSCEQGDHKCTLLCHPGPCEQCQATITRYCHCQKSSKMMQCYQKEEIVCDETCNQLLNCLTHTCTRKCHSDPCGECTAVIEHICYCEKSHKTVPCTPANNETKTFQCQNICDRMLGCGNHTCKELCHVGPCGECQLLPKFIKTCNCGKEELPADLRKSCLDEVPVCKNVCKKVLKCGTQANPHFCTSKCHVGECPPCKKSTKVRCRCGHMDQEVKCKTLVNGTDDVTCSKRCTKLKSCGRHKCNTDCCIDFDHQCLLVCNKKLTCGKHRCEEMCHKGPCRPCLISSFDELFCECGANVIYPPVPCGTKKPACEKPCPRSHPCEHPVLHNCHTAAKCPPCVIQTTKYCYGKHEQRKTIPCHEESFSCGMPCGKSLSCGRHKCLKVCHKEEMCLKEGDICKQRCNRARLDCGHQCGAACHDGECPDIICKENVEITCECGNRKQMRICHDLSREYRRIANAQLATSMMDIQNGGAVKLSEILGPIKKGSNKTLECNDECKLLERNKRLEMAFGPSTENTKLAPAYTEFLKTYAKKDMALVKDIHMKLTNLVKLAKDSKQKSRSHSFPVMNREKRQVVHEMCEAFGIQSQAFDADPNRNVVATANKDMCFCPTMSVMEVLQRESGQRVRIPVSQSAWRLPSAK